VEFQEGCKSCKALVDYSSHPVPFNMKKRGEPFGNPREWLEFNCKEPVDFILALKYDARFLDLYHSFNLPVEPGGYIAFNSEARLIEDRWEQVDEWRTRRDAWPLEDALFCFMGVDGWPNRKPLICRLQELGVTLNGPGPRLRWPQYIEEMTRTRFGLNLPGWGDAICYRTIEYCCLGVPFVSGPELLSLILPWGARFEHGVNHFVVRSMDEVPASLSEMSDPQVYSKLTRGSRQLFDDVFRPGPTGRWWIQVARKYLR
jgi:hypothetical protein